MKIEIIFFSLIIFWNNAFGQSLDLEVKNRIEKNIIVGQVFENINKGDFYNGKTDDLILDDGWHLDLKYNFINDVNFPNKNYVFYQVLNYTNNLINPKTKQISTKLSYDVNVSNPVKKFLVGINKKDNHYLYFIDGDFVKSRISHEFELNSKEPKTFLNFLKIKLYNHKISDLKFLQRGEGKLIFRGFSNRLGKNIDIEIDDKDFDKVQIIN